MRFDPLVAGAGAGTFRSGRCAGLCPYPACGLVRRPFSRRAAPRTGGIAGGINGFGADGRAGSAAGAYTISLPANDIVKITNGTPAVDMYVNSFTAKTLSAGIDGFTGLLDINGADSFVVGATLKLANAQPFGVYAGTFDVTVNYN